MILWNADLIRKAQGRIEIMESIFDLNRIIRRHAAMHDEKINMDVDFRTNATDNKRLASKERSDE